MKNSFLTKWFIISAVAATTIVAGATAFGQSQTNKLRVGVYDSRAIAIAYGNSAAFKESMKPIEADFKKAKEEKNEKGMKEIDARMKLRQRRAHEQAFSTGSVTGCLDKVKESLPDVAKQAGVQVIVSKWELNYQSGNVELVDVTDKLVALFQPSPKVLGWVKDLKNRQPLPMDQITDDMD